MRLYLDRQQLLDVAEEHRVEYAAADPFPHVVLDGLFPDEMLDTAVASFPDVASDVWKRYDNYHEVKLETQGEELLGDELSFLLYQFNSAPFLEFLERLTGITGLIPDPYFAGGGLHQIPAGGKLGVHADFSRHTKLSLQRRLNVLVFLNHEWKDEYGGQLELWDRDVTECRQRISPVFNRTVVFSITDWAFHGHPHPLTCPPGVTRKSIALYYFTVDRPDGETMDGKESTLFVQRPNEVVPANTPMARGAAYTGVKESPRKRAVRNVQRVTPPILFDAVMRAAQEPRLTFGAVLRRDPVPSAPC